MQKIEQENIESPESGDEIRKKRIDFFPYLINSFFPFTRGELEKLGETIGQIDKNKIPEKYYLGLTEGHDRVWELFEKFVNIKEPVSFNHVRDIYIVGLDESKTETEIQAEPIETDSEGRKYLEKSERDLMREFINSLNHYFINSLASYGYAELWEYMNKLSPEDKDRVEEIMWLRRNIISQIEKFNDLSRKDPECIYFTEDRQAIDIDKTLAELNKQEDSNGPSENK